MIKRFLEQAEGNPQGHQALAGGSTHYPEGSGDNGDAVLNAGSSRACQDPRRTAEKFGADLAGAMYDEVRLIMPPVTYTWHIEDRRVRCTLDYVEFKKGLRKTLPPKSYYDCDKRTGGQVPTHAAIPHS